jgi:adenosylhomocysteine nucleosidase
LLTIIATIEQEVAGLRRELQLRGTAAAGAEGLLPRQPVGGGVQLQVVGVGQAQAEARVQALFESRTGSGATGDQPDRLLLLGFAGAADPLLGPGELSLPTRYYLAQEGEVQRDFLEPDGRMWRQAVEAAADAGLPASQLDSLTVEHLVVSPAGKLALAREYHVGAVNMEDYWVAAAAKAAGVPFLSVRAVLDTASQRLPDFLLGLAEHRAKAILMAVAMPWRVPTFLRLGRQMRLAQHRLAGFALAFIDLVYDLEENWA